MATTKGKQQTLWQPIAALRGVYSFLGQSFSGLSNVDMASLAGETNPFFAQETTAPVTGDFSPDGNFKAELTRARYFAGALGGPVGSILGCVGGALASGLADGFDYQPPSQSGDSPQGGGDGGVGTLGAQFNASARPPDDPKTTKPKKAP